ncbi:MAG: pilus assembly protein PilP [Burkholderiales bacterium PBB6]|nr:MAG: pilus assembly protein PilP [Burkholderiales bacterium PBB6]
MNQRWIASLCLLACLGACSSDDDELKAWMDQQKQEVKPSVEPIAAPKKFTPQAYTGVGAVDPFGAQKMASGNKLDANQSGAMLASEAKRRKEPLEAFPLDGMVMVGSMTRDKRQYAILKVEALLHYVKVGEYLGLNYGKITKITETEITLREIVQDAAGEWIERNSTLQLQETAR